MRQKGIYPYEYVNRLGKFEETKLPWKNKFYRKLKMKLSSDQGYEHAQQIQNRITPELKNVTWQDYHDVYIAQI